MRKRNYKGRVQKRVLPKSREVVRTYDEIQNAFVDLLMDSDDIISFSCNYPLDGLEGDYVSDIVATKSDGSIMVRECVFRHQLLKPLTVKMLEKSRKFWQSKTEDWGIVTNAEK